MNQLPPAPPAGQPGQPPIPPPQPVAIPVPMLPQPDFIRLSQGLLTVTQEIALVPNVPLQGIFNVIMASLNRIEGEVAQVAAGLRAVEHWLDRNNIELTLVPIQIFNASVNSSTNIMYPPGIHIVPGMPLTRMEIHTLMGANCQVTAAALGLPNLPVTATVMQRHQQIIEYLGAY
ncbi:hypothetical protein E4T56_gene19329 [Termitomyces sp. T112]|nr:hypothetical protein E4T56_gene19329 [Termitomyces sp. T112]